MRSRLVLHTLAMLLFSALSQAQEVGVMTFNIRYGAADDGANSWRYRKEMVAETIREQAPAAMGLQECLRFQAEELDAMLPDYHWFGVGRNQDGDGEMCAIFYRPDTFVPVSWETFWLSEQPEIPGSVSWDSSLTRIASIMRLRHITSGKTLYLLNTHFDHRGETARRESAKLIVQRTADITEEAPLVVMGDFNAISDASVPWETMMDAGFRGAWETAKERSGPATTWCAFSAPDPEATSRIDWILLRGPARALNCETVNYNVEGRYPSDHLPVFATINMGDAEEETH